MNEIKIIGLFLNLILYIIIILPIIILVFNKQIYRNKKTLIKSLVFVTILEILFSFIIYALAEKIFSIFTQSSGIINYAVYASKIIFITSSLYGIKFLLPAYLFYSLPSERKKTTILFLSKIVVNIISILICQILFGTKIALYSICIYDFIYYIIYLILFIKVP